jgi:hypothetical protein
MRNAILILLGLFSLAGCGWASRTSSTSADNQAWLRVTSDPAELKGAQERADAVAREEYEGVFQSLGKGYLFLDLESLEVLQRRRADAVIRLEGNLAAGRISAAGIDAALLLCRLNSTKGREYVARALREGDATQRGQVVRGIAGPIISIEHEPSRKYREFLLADEALAAALLAQLDDADATVVKDAVQTCGMLNPPGLHERLLRLARRQGAADRERVLFWLSKGPLTAEALDLALPAAASPSQGSSSHGSDSLLVAFAEHEDAKLRERVRAELKRRLAASPDDGKLGFRGDRLGMLEALAKTSTAADLDWLRKAAYAERGLYAQTLLAALVRLEGAKGKKRLFELFQDPERRVKAVEIAADVYAGSEDPALVAELSRVAAGRDAKGLPQICNALLAIGGEAAKAEIERLAPRLDPVALASVRRSMAGQTAEAIVAGVAESKLFDETTVAAAAERLKRPSADPRAGEPELLDLLIELNVVVFFDAETGELPCRHDRLLLDFAAHSQAKFAPTAVSQEWQQKHEDDEAAPYVLRFIQAGKLYTGALRNNGDWYDVERVVELINRALADAACEERFVPLATGDQMAAFVFAEPTGLASLAERFHLPLSSDANAAMQAGKEFEERVIQGIREK